MKCILWIWVRGGGSAGWGGSSTAGWAGDPPGNPQRITWDGRRDQTGSTQQRSALFSIRGTSIRLSFVVVCGRYLDDVNREPLTEPKHDRPTNTVMIQDMGPRWAFPKSCRTHVGFTKCVQQQVATRLMVQKPRAKHHSLIISKQKVKTHHMI